MAARQPEGELKDDIRDNHAKPNDLLFWQIEGKSKNGVPDTLAGKMSGGGILIEFKRFGQKPTEQQWLRIFELREAGIEAWWCDSVAGYRKLVGLDPGGYKVQYPSKIHALIAIGTTADSFTVRRRRRRRRARPAI
jgi:hypothetical protein